MRKDFVDNATVGELPHDLIFAIQHVYQPVGMTVTTEAFREAESAEYGACRFVLDGHMVVFRVAKTTPTKVGQFVTCWKRSVAKIMPLDLSDNVDFLVVNVSDAIHRGQFVFPQKTLVERGIMSANNEGGKLAFRIYPPWTKPVAKAAIKSQQWQLNYFFSFTEANGIDLERVRKLFFKG